VKKFLLGIAFGALALPAAAADMPVKAPPVAIDIWTGGYVGANVGYSWGRDTVDSVGSPGNCSYTGAGCTAAPVNYFSPLMAQVLTFQTSIDRSGVIYGGQAGHNWLVHNIAWNWDGVLGVEVDFQGVSDSHSTTLTSAVGLPPPATPGFAFSQTATLSERIDSFGTVRGRAGVLWGPNTLIYGTGGVAFANVRATSSFGQNLVGPPVPAGFTFPYFGSGTVNTELWGPVIGGGVEWKWTANWSIKAEYLYADFGTLTVNAGALQFPVPGGFGGSATAQTTSHLHENIARVGVNYRFW
jgi:outer membrane immunogenic protein